MSDISVIIPTWNSATTLKKAIRSALVQTLPPLEVLVCDDGSTDESRDIVHSINDSRVRWIDGDRSRRPAIPRNRGIRASRGKWLAFLDSDDVWLPEKLEKQLEHANKMMCDAACSNAIRYVPSQGYLGPVYRNNNLKESILFSNLIQNNYVICSSALIRKEVVDKCNGFPEDMTVIAVEDYALWLRAATFTDFAFVNEPLLIYRDEPEASIRAYGRSAWKQRINVLKSFISWARDNDYTINNKEYLKLAQKFLLYAQIENTKWRCKTMLLNLKGWTIK